MEDGAAAARARIEVQKGAISRRRLFLRRSFWDALLAETASIPVTYHGYSFAHRADLFRLELTAEARARLAGAAASLAPRAMRKDLQTIAGATRIVFILPRSTTP